MQRSRVLGALVLIGALSISVSALQQGSAPERRVVEVQKLRDNLYVMTGGGGNSTVLVGTDGVTVVDTKNPGWGQPLIDRIKAVTSKPITRIINTHTHGDHVSGNVEFGSVEVVAQVNTAENMKVMRANSTAPQTPAPNIFQQHKGHGLPTRTFTDTLTVGQGNDRIELRYFGRGHTNGDAFVLFPALRVLAAGDIFARKDFPLLDQNNGGSAAAIGATLDKAYAAYQGKVDSVVTGHAAVMTLADMREYATFNKEFFAEMAAHKNAGKPVEEVFKTYQIPARFKGYGPDNAAAAPGSQTRLRGNIQLAYNEAK